MAQDQIWAKPPGSPPLVFHRDSPYFDFTPADVVTVWIALDDMHKELGPLEYVQGSHHWEGRTGSASQFFDKDTKALLRSAASLAGVSNAELESRIVSMAGMQAGGASIHNGLTWHGSGGNKSDGARSRARRGIGIHFIPFGAKFDASPEKPIGRLWRPFQQNDDTEPPDVHFPVTYAEPRSRDEKQDISPVQYQPHVDADAATIKINQTRRVSVFQLKGMARRATVTEECSVARCLYLYHSLSPQ
uniref:Phytanoyl-CoA dioxygenase n=1 Tax=Octactis speculum TaxID=3111310 RepID=A0A7S2B8F2_9STRA